MAKSPAISVLNSPFVLNLEEKKFYEEIRLYRRSTAKLHENGPHPQGL